ncbi:ABC transporter ATP-binding protein [Marinicrinis lubricantis]|uniref:ABC transporter ATP-binding protein n=1 Tax=Marinicrinis lubricantis TaxID=2086470 RepID=A0ABW1IR82_9BACL
MGSTSLPPSFAAAIILGLGETILSLLIPLLTMDMVEQIAVSDLKAATIGLLASVFALQTAFSGFSVYTMSYVGQYVIQGLRDDIWRQVLKLPIPFFDRNHSGETMSRVTNDTNVIKDFIIGHVISFLGGIVSIIGGVSILIWIDWRMTLLMLLAVPAALLVLWPLGSRMFRVSKSVQDETAAFQGDLGRVLTEIRLVKSSLAEPTEEEQGLRRIRSLFRFGLQEARIMSIVTPFMMTIMLLLLVVLMGYGGVRVAQGSLATGELVAILLYMFQIIMPFTQMASFFTQFQKALGASQRIIELLEERTEEEVLQANRSTNHSGTDRGLSTAATNFSCSSDKQPIVFEQLSFGYVPDRPVLHALSFAAEPDQMTAFVGPSGTGKTTLFSLIERFYLPTAGYISYGTQPIHTIPLSEWRSKIAYVSQDSPMMAGTIRHNLTYGLGQVEESKLLLAVKQANLSHFIDSLPEGLETDVGERGIKLSGGQRQRLAIARAIVRDPDILLLDEATAHLDSESEKLVQEALQQLMQGRTTLVIAHRLSTIRTADKIIILEEGTITGEGTHSELMQSHELYSTLVQQQFLGISES